MEDKKLLLRIAVLGYCVVLYALIATGAFSTQRIGAMTWGPTTDLWASAIAISDITLGMDGGIGRRELSFAMAKVLSPSGSDISVLDAETRRRVQDPDLVTKAFQDAATIDTATIKTLPLDSGMFVTTVFEDIGYADFYGIAFRIFGYDAFSTYKLYMCLLGLSALVFMAGQWRSSLGLSVLALALSGLFLLTTSMVFAGPGIPSLAANRALGTLSVLPVLYIILAAFDDRPAMWLTRSIVATQVLLFAFFVFLRTSAIWAVVALGVILVAAIVIRAASRQAIHILGAALIVVAGYSAVRTSQLHLIYDTDDILPHHLRWHSAYLALVDNPEYVKYPEFFGDKGETGDQIAWSAYRRFMASQFPNTPALSRVSGNNIKSRLHESIMKARFFEFATAHPRYMLDLYFYYKPARYLSAIKTVIASVPTVAWIIAAPAWILFMLSLLADRSRTFRIKTMPAIGILFLCSFAPFIWAYATPYTVFDHFIVLGVAASILAGWCASLIVSRLGRLAHQ